MNYQETLHYLYNQLPMFSRSGAPAITKDLNNTLALCKLLGDPQRQFKSVHVGGTNGKGSTSHMLAAILQTAGYKTGLYTSPHLHDFRERIRINGQMIAQQQVVDFVAAHISDFEHIRPSFFEMTVGLAFEAFAKAEVDIALIEVGLGGRLDSTNVISPLLSIITNIGWDHMNLLGHTLPLIAAEKAGIIKPGVPVIIGERQSEVSDIFLTRASSQGSRLIFASDIFDVDASPLTDWRPAGGDLLPVAVKPKNQPGAVKNLSLDLTGTYQLKNLKTVLAAVDELRRLNFHITDAHIAGALTQVRKLTGLNGRWQIIGQNPLTICDTGHNPDGIAEVLKNIAAVQYRQLHFVLGMVSDKDSSKILALLPKNAVYYFCRPDIPRGLPAADLQSAAAKFALNGDVYPSVNAALQAARAKATAADLVFAGGSTFVVAEIV